ncbi:MAG TPA: gamma-glutamyl-gamma-aminobutyrate hydrolase family protein [Dongiaceae bacterium]|jgi:putative glutamine amidotransferase|nr:gamma-glutamyl-gamma-aminobutyrate hydrolase family protein [Dongiaceae bacterium]
MKFDSKSPLIGIPVCVREQEGHPFHSVGEKYITGVALGAGGLPLLIPALGDAFDHRDLVRRLDGLLVTGSPSNVAVDLYGGPPDRADSPQDPKRDATTLPLIRAAVEDGLPLFCICRGIQELNVAFGGTLHTRVHEQPDTFDHRAPAGDVDFRYGPRHPVDLAPDGEIARLVGSRQIEVNSLHWQAIDRLADRLVIEGRAPDGVVEAVRVRDARSFALGVQWHPEWKVLLNPVSVALFRAFGDAARRRAEQRAARGLAA